MERRVSLRAGFWNRGYIIKILSVVIAMIFVLSGCSTQREVPTSDDKYRNYYEVFVRSFYDSNGDGIGDINGIIEKLDYLNDGDNKKHSDLGIDGIWLMPIMPSPTYHKYDVTDYYSIDDQYGTMEDFEKLINECNMRGIKVILDLVLNHTSYRHPWFTSARESIGIEPCGQEVCKYEELCSKHNKYCAYYNFSKEPKGKGYYNIGRPNGWYYEGVFWDQMPDLNLQNEELLKDIISIGEFWIDKGVSGFRLDAVTQFYGENISKNNEFLKEFYEAMKEYKDDVYMVGEAWTNAGSIEEYYESGIDSFFNFPYAQATGNIVNAVRMGIGRKFSEDLEIWQKSIKGKNKDAIDAVFLSNHDNGRSAGYLGRDLGKEKMAASLYLMMPGNSFIYYGEEIGMIGSGIDENKRMPFLWSNNSKEGIAYAPPNATQTENIEVGVIEQEKDKDSLLEFYKKAIRLKNSNKEIARGTVKSIDLGNDSICAYSSSYEGSKIIIIHNLGNGKAEVQLSKKQYEYERLSGYLSANNKKVILKGEKLVLPPMSTAVIR